MQTVHVLYSKDFDIGCFSHTIDHVGEMFNTPVLKEFTSAWIPFSHAVCRTNWPGSHKLIMLYIPTQIQAGR